MYGGYQLGKYAERNRHDEYEQRNRRQWSESEEKQWRATTQAPYFENKVPGSESYLPASAVVGEFQYSFSSIAYNRFYFELN